MGAQVPSVPSRRQEEGHYECRGTCFSNGSWRRSLCKANRSTFDLGKFVNAMLSCDVIALTLYHVGLVPNWEVGCDLDVDMLGILLRIARGMLR